MAIQSLQLASFRNHESKSFEFSPGLTVIWGENGSGKTAVLEAIHTLSFGKSFRTHQQRELIRNGDSAMVTQGRFSHNQSQDDIAAQVSKSSGQKLKLNGKMIRGRKELLRRNNVVVLSPEEQSVTKGAPAERRQFFDKMFSVSSFDYVDMLLDYTRILKQRNAAVVLLKENKIPISELLSWDTSLVQSGFKLWESRQKHIQDFQVQLKKVVSMYDQQIQFELQYAAPVQSVNEYESQIKQVQKKDIAIGRTTFGPHRDDFILSWSNRDLRSFGSQGEHKLSLVLLKLAELNFIQTKTGTHPTLLLDDLFAKLDLDRSRKIVSLLQGLASESGEQVQTIVTTTDILNVEKSGLLSKHDANKTYHLER